MRNNKMIKKIDIFIGLISIIISLFIIYTFNNKEPVGIFIIYINIFYLSFKLKHNKKNIMIYYFVICNFIFNTSIALTNFLDNQYAINSMFFTNFKLFNNEISSFIYRMIYLNNLGILLAILIIYATNKKRKHVFKNRQEKSSMLKFMSKALLYFVPVYIFINISNIKLVAKIGYAASYLYTNKNVNYYIMVLFGYFIIIFLSLKCKNKKLVKKVSGVYLFVLFIGSLTGSRGHFLIGVIFIIWYLEMMNIYKLKKKTIVLLLLFVFLYSDALSNLRQYYGKTSSEKIKVFEVQNILDKPIRFLKSQNGSGSMIGYLKVYPEIIDGDNNGKMIMSSIYMFFDSFFRKELVLGRKINYDIGRKKSDFSRVSYIINYEKVKRGYGLGGNYIVEMYEVGREYGVFILSIIFVFIIYWLENLIRLDISIYSNIFAMMVLNNIFMAPRSYYLDFNIRSYLYILGFYFIISQMIIILKRRRINYENIIKKS